MSCFVIAEIGVNHNGNLDLAKELILAAKTAKADAVKFQSFYARKLATLDTPKVAYQIKNSGRDESHFEMLSSLELSEEEHIELNNFCNSAEIEFMSTPYDIDSARFLNDTLNIKRFKVASADLVDLPLHQYISETGKPSIVSTGMATLGEIEKAMQTYGESNLERVTLLHCTSNYPCRDESANLRALNTLRTAFGVNIGYSDHTEGTTASIMALAYGAKVIEKHLTLDKGMKGPDHKASADPKELTYYIREIRRAEAMLGSGRKFVAAEEMEMRRVSRKSARARRAIKKGEMVTHECLHMLRPGEGLNGSELDQLLGKIARRDIGKNELVLPKDIE